jgi:hypothetical protein
MVGVESAVSCLGCSFLEHLHESPVAVLGMFGLAPPVEVPLGAVVRTTWDDLPRC